MNGMRKVLGQTGRTLVILDRYSTMTDKKFYDFTAKDIDGNEVSMSKYK